MAALVAKASGKAGSAATWTPEQVPTNADDCTVGSGFTVKVDAAQPMRSLETTGSGKVEVTKTLTLGTSTTNSNKILKLAEASLSVTGSGKIAFSASGANEEQITLNGNDLVSCNFGGGTVKYKFMDTFRASSLLTHKGGTITTNNQALNIGAYEAESATAKELVLGSSTITTGGFTASAGTTLTIKAETSTVILTATNASLAVGGRTLNAVTFQGEQANITESSTIAALSLALTGSKEAFFFKGTTTTITSALTAAVGTTLRSDTPGAPAKLKKSSGTITLEGVKVKDITAEGGASWRDVNGEDLGGNTGWLFNVSMSRSCVDEASIADAVARLMASSRAVSDSATVSDSVGRLQSTTRAATDAASASDVVTRAQAVARIAVDEAFASDAVTRTLALTRAASDAASVSDATVSLLAQSRSVGDEAVASDATSRTGALSRSCSDEATVSDSASISQSSTRIVSDEAMIGDVATVEGGNLRSALDSATVSDVVTRLAARTRSGTDGATVSDAVTRGVELMRTASDSATVTDAAMRLSVMMIRFTSDEATWTDAASGELVASPKSPTRIIIRDRPAARIIVRDRPSARIKITDRR